MYKHILIPTDGSETAEQAVEAGLRFAKWAGAKVTAFTAGPEYHPPGTSEVVAHRVVPMAEFEQRALEKARAVIDGIAKRAREEGVECEAEAVLSDQPWRAIIDAAEKHGCDLICIASHGRKGLPGLLYGSETHEVLTHSRIPTLVIR